MKTIRNVLATGMIALAVGFAGGEPGSSTATSDVFVGLTEPTAPASDEWDTSAEALAFVLCGATVCMESPGWICADSANPDPEDVLWNYCNWRMGSDPFEGYCDLPE